jgi:hypothetical protein
MRRSLVEKKAVFQGETHLREKALVQQTAPSAIYEARHIPQKWSQIVIDVGTTIVDYERVTHTKQTTGGMDTQAKEFVGAADYERERGARRLRPAGDILVRSEDKGALLCSHYLLVQASNK